MGTRGCLRRSTAILGTLSPELFQLEVSMDFDPRWPDDPRDRDDYGRELSQGSRGGLSNPHRTPSYRRQRAPTPMGASQSTTIRVPINPPATLLVAREVLVQERTSATKLPDSVRQRRRFGNFEWIHASTNP